MKMNGSGRTFFSRFRCLASLGPIGLLAWLATISGWPAEEPVFGPAAATVRQRMHVSNPEVIRTLATNGARLLASYESFQVWDVPGETATALVGRAGVTLHQGDNVIELHARKIDTSGGKERVARSALSSFSVDLRGFSVSSV